MHHQWEAAVPLSDEENKTQEYILSLIATIFRVRQLSQWHREGRKERKAKGKEVQYVT